jgi:hypothetical protein
MIRAALASALVVTLLVPAAAHRVVERFSLDTGKMLQTRSYTAEDPVYFLDYSKETKK